MTVPHAPKRLGKALVVLSLIAAGVAVPAAPAQAADGCSNEGLTSGSVDGREIRYTRSSRYTGEFTEARDLWNRLGRVNIAPDTATTVNDLHISDVTRSTVTWSGYWQSSAGQDDIYLNLHFLTNYSWANRRGVIGHEIGHALRLGHFDNRTALMHCSDNRTTTAPASLDINKYREIWG
ncbi:hypothetical protein [Micromonospora sp. NPDC003241]